MAKILIYTKNNCPYCTKAKNFLESKGLKEEIEEINVENNPEKRDEFLAKSNGLKTFPQIFINGFHVGGCDNLLALSNEKRNELLKGRVG
jgi:glutaredoxin 3